MMTSSNGSFFRVTGPLRWIHGSPVNFPHKGPVMRTLMFLWCGSALAIKQTVEWSVIWNSMTFMLRHRNVHWNLHWVRLQNLNEWYLGSLTHISRVSCQKGPTQVGEQPRSGDVHRSGDSPRSRYVIPRSATAYQDQGCFRKAPISLI